MSIRFRKSIKLAPGIRMNLSGSGISFGFGPRGASISVGKRGTYLNTGIPGTGLYSRQRIGGSNNTTSSPSSSRIINMTVNVEVNDDGTIEFKDSEGNFLPPNIVNIAKKQQGEVIQKLINQKCDEINEQIESIGEIHLYTPEPNIKPKYQSQEFIKPEPIAPILKKAGFFDKLFGHRQEKIEKENKANENRFIKESAEWKEEKQRFYENELQRKTLIENDIYTDSEAMENFLEENLQSIIWPRETLISTEIYNNGKQIFIDVDLPEVEDIPNKIATVPQRGYKLTVKEMTARQIQQLYMKHIHGIGFRIIGETFSALPNTQQVTLSAYSQRANTTTGQITDDYLYSVQVDRNSWSEINFQNLQNLDIVEALAQFNMIRKMTKTGNFQMIQPFSPAAF
ncbi:MAG: DUF4236 domain-containing protein [Sediminibacterium sp.]|uniref:DUF4236 domain-containing protein n=1 Tax=Sediminibacterium sp. TaxID=1917865 RepID=UPI00271CA00F|nr:DUF4236 domain-containing protein [Sediminibacterium sp.]MDO8997663.1 DUF4236 domain-containing protein [Sediminibacterium sp.]